MQNNKQYGLIKLTKGGPKPITNKVVNKPSIFGESESDEDEETSVAVQYESSNLRKQTQAKITQAIEQDPNIFQYDEVYDDMKSATAKPIITKAEKKPRYMANLLKAAELRKKEQEIREERKIQKEREQEGDEFKDKEAFVTSAYREKLEEMKQTQEDADYEEAKESILDVTKQNNLNGFYRSLYKNSIFNDKDSEQENITFNKKSTDRKKISLRERNLDDDDEDEEDTEITGNANDSNDDDELRLEKDPPLNIEPDSKDNIKSDKPDPNSVEESKIEVVQPEKKPKLTRQELIRKIFTKRTVDKAFDEAKQRYLERKALLSV